jgi:hypothetical protein
MRVMESLQINPKLDLVNFFNRIAYQLAALASV